MKRLDFTLILYFVWQLITFSFVFLVAGANLDPATDTFAGPGPFSEPETRSLSQYIRSIGNKLDLYISIHSFGQLLLLPFGNSTAPYGNYNDAVSNLELLIIVFKGLHLK